ncbi:MAG: hypothetical protein MRECE_12c008 [Mycoplasmataceae bacterium CE_OT135]|nr:MAG: hypothetical protein MRECE_12c008 [Mycoplasmataceae bacterium CE_OT135]
MKIIKGFCLHCQKKRVLVFRLPTRRYWAYCESCLTKYFAEHRRSTNHE